MRICFNFLEEHDRWMGLAWGRGTKKSTIQQWYPRTYSAPFAKHCEPTWTRDPTSSAPLLHTKSLCPGKGSLWEDNMPVQNCSRFDWVRHIMSLYTDGGFVLLSFLCPVWLWSILFFSPLVHGIHVFSSTVLIQEALAAFRRGETDIVEKKKECEVSDICRDESSRQRHYTY